MMAQQLHVLVNTILIGLLVTAAAHEETAFNSSSPSHMESCRTLSVEDMCDNMAFDNSSQDINVCVCFNSLTISTYYYKNVTSAWRFIPGKIAQISSIFGNTTTNVYKISVIPTKNSDISVDPAYVYTSNLMTKLLGRPKATGKLTVALLCKTAKSVSIQVEMLECPPGWKYDKKKRVCTCLTNYYDGILGCNRDRFTALLHHRYWAGYISYNDEGHGTEFFFRTSSCPIGYCGYNKKEITIPLPNTTSREAINKAVCYKNRKGILCGQCEENTSVHYHNGEYFACYPESNLCTFGWIFYILSELVPVTIFFAVVLWFDVKFTTGAVGAFVFYAQVFDILNVSASAFIWFKYPIYVLLDILRVIVRVFNLTFFSVEKLSFCLWKGASTLDIIAFNYATIIYSFFLIIITVALANRCSIKMNRIFSVDKSYLSNSIIHGLSSFLVLCYSLSTRISLLLLTPATLNGGKKFSRVFYDGELYYFKGKHLLYAVPAVFFLIFITLLPPLLLLCYPLCYKFLAFCKLEESKFTKVLCKVIPLEKYKPFFDSFQGTFKDEHCYFAGLFFIYRLTFIMIFILARHFLTLYALLQLQLILMLFLHAIVRPHKIEWHNRMDIFVFALMALINGFTASNYLSQASFVYDPDGTLVSINSSLQILLAWVPLVSMFLYIIAKPVQRMCVRLRKRASSSDEIGLSIMEDRDQNMTRYVRRK